MIVWLISCFPPILAARPRRCICLIDRRLWTVSKELKAASRGDIFNT